MTMSQVLLLLLFYSSIFINPNAQNPCPSRTCNGVEIKYPFWQIDETTSAQFCGYPGFGLNCSNPSKDPVLSLPKDSYSVPQINYKNNTLTLIDTDVFQVQCPRVRHNFTSETLPIYQTPQDSNITFYFNCSSPPPIPSTEVDCLASKTSQNKSYVVEVTTTESRGFEGWYEICEEKVDVVVKKAEIERNEAGLVEGFGKALNEGFLLDWKILSECNECEESKGRCGYNNIAKEFLCFCEDNTTRTNNQSCRGSKKSKGLIIGAAIGGVGILLFLMAVVFILYRRKNPKQVSYAVSRNVSSYSFSMSDSEKGSGTYMGVRTFSYNELEKATNNFDASNELGDGGFGTVYKGKLQDGREVAVKRLYENSMKRVEQFMNEIVILTQLRHPNLVVLYGSTSQECRKLLLVYEYIPNGTIADHLYGEDAERGKLTWKTRMSIAIQTASALSYLHVSDVIHRDVKTTNILLDDNFHVKVADFGLSRLFPVHATHVSTAPQGTPGYVDPEYHQCYQLTSKSDVYSFGVVLIELISSKPAVDITRHRHEINLANLAINKIQGNALHELVDPSLGFESDYEVKRMITEVAELAFRCLQNDRELRPSMDEVHKSLKEIQSRNYSGKHETEHNLSADHVSLLKNYPQNHSPDSVTIKWGSNSTNTSSSN
ncbi:LEAF RUST 10 DISEASE-RESISTANCE LOCUS RECEPTOR-LIKE PROTEIN KINASE-like 1.2 isoform X10 [Daucus carota subsp. sativus]|uniref:LEAF RUST 10 DISEASE-RESISTANCE LOCUS RECEPTOR-LIKE PROTEIN KINASE-like 1.2 isoform X10 n=1 Tax=Daucus carota subsp. sativus TaxID=79200 RepID=UPI0007EF1FF2|nr:PREDICTED: LEAF RUST 10 DISEASE-RESISTANCE LOCUS RECEPTOR-LIKE PROTEIN KINASE-like 1.2 isoform X9 [Daucus carota subsp. sativus]